jgi:hypothetical protein
VSEPARTTPSPTAANANEDDVQEALAIWGRRHRGLEDYIDGQRISGS